MRGAPFRGRGPGRSLGWIGFVAGRHVSPRGRRNSPSPVLAVLGIGTGVLALTVILAVMNGFQLGFIESILEISSYHIRIERPPETEGDLVRRLLALPGIRSVLPFRESQAIVRGKGKGIQAAVIRGLPEDAPERDPGLAAKLKFEEGCGSFDLRSPGSILLGTELARRLALRVGDEVSLVSISGDGLFSLGTDGPGDDRFTVTGIFFADFFEYDLGWAFINIHRAAGFDGGGESPVLGIKIGNRWQDLRILEETAEILASYPSSGGEGPELSTWRDYNRAFFAALRTEKLLMFTLVGLIFIVVGLNIFQTQRRVVLERREEIGLFRALGAPDLAVRLVFVWDGFVIGLLGAALGMILGLLIAAHIAAFFSILETLVNFFIGLVNDLSRFLGGGAVSGEFALFSPQIFYIKTIPSRIIPHEVVLIFMFGFLSALLAAWFASGKVSRTSPAEVLRYE